MSILDYLNGQVDYGDDKSIRSYVGIDSGKTIMIVGKPGSGKSTLALQLVSGVMKRYDESTLFIEDFEQSWTEARVKSVTGMSDAYYNDHVTMSKVGIYTGTVLKLVRQIAAFKTEHAKELLTDNKEGYLDKDGKPIKILPPTFIVVDSLAYMRTEDSQEGDKADEISGLSAGARNAIANKDLMTRILQPCMVGNIIVVFINHVSSNIGMGVTPPVAQTRFMGNTESVSGGSAIQYGANLWLKVEAGNKLEEKDKYGIKGFEAKITIVKSRNSEAGKSALMIFNQREGFDEELSEFEFLKANSVVQGAGVSMFLPGLETVKFRMSNLKEKLATVPEFKALFDNLVQQYLFQSISVSSKVIGDSAAKGSAVTEDPTEVEMVDTEATDVTADKAD
jgi:RecA/RadA recombinase